MPSAPGLVLPWAPGLPLPWVPGLPLPWAPALLLPWRLPIADRVAAAGAPRDTTASARGAIIVRRAWHAGVLKHFFHSSHVDAIATFEHVKAAQRL